MLIYRNSEVAFNYRFLRHIIVVVLLSLSALAHPSEVSAPPTLQFERIDAQTIKDHTRQILSEPEFAPRKTFWQWLRGKLSGIKGPKLKLPPGVGKTILWIIIIWCVLSLIAILIHFIWSISLLVRPRSKSIGKTKGSALESARARSFEELYSMAQGFAREGSFHQAISFIAVALLRWLDSADILRFHESKTNGDYIREYPSDHISRNEFKQFVTIFEQTIYGRLHREDQTYQQMNSLMEHIRSSVSQN